MVKIAEKFKIKIVYIDTNRSLLILSKIYPFRLLIDTDCCTRQCCGPARPFDLKIFDNSNQEVIHLQRPLRCSECCCPCCLQELEVTSPPGTVIGYIIQKLV